MQWFRNTGLVLTSWRIQPDEKVRTRSSHLSGMTAGKKAYAVFGESKMRDDRAWESGLASRRRCDWAELPGVK